MRFSSKSIEKKVTSNLIRLIGKPFNNVKLLLLISGGVDSLVLFDILTRLKSKYKFSLILFHVNYNYHNKSIEMSQLCKDLSKLHNLKIFTENINSKQKFRNSNFEASARQFRYKEAQKLASEKKIDYVLTAHHEDDQIETIYMMRKFKNTSWESKIGIRDSFNIGSIFNINSKIKLIRPMLDVSKLQILKYSKTKEILYCKDPTNDDIKFLRNKVRFNIKNRVNDENFRNFHLSLAKNNMSKLKYLSNQISLESEKIIDFVKQFDFLKINKIKIASKNMDFIKFFLKEIIFNNFNISLNLSQSSWNQLVKFIANEKRVQKFYELDKKTNLFMSLCSQYLYIFINKTNNVKIIDSLGNYESRFGSVSVSISNDNEILDRLDIITMPIEYLNRLELNFWESADKYIENEMTKKVSNLFVNQKFNIFEKKHYPIIKYKSQIIWIPKYFKSYNNKIDGKKILLKWNEII